MKSRLMNRKLRYNYEVGEGMNTTETANALGVSVCRVWQLIHAKRLQARKVGGQWSIDAGSVQDYQRTRQRGRPVGPGYVYAGRSIPRRRNKVRALHAEGKSVAYIAEHLGVHSNTVRRDLKEVQP